MAKTVLVMDMPNFCDQCPIVALDEEIGFYCPKMMNELPEMIAYKAKVGDYFYKGKPDWCPLIQEPEKKPDMSVTVNTGNVSKRDLENLIELGKAVGWNACIDAIEGRMNQIE